jgi:hypothetical protein
MLAPSRFTNQPHRVLRARFLLSDFVSRRLIHGGAWDIPRELHEAHAQGQASFVVGALFTSSRIVFRRCAAAYTAACAARAAGADGLSIVIAALDVLEEDWTFDAGAPPPPVHRHRSMPNLDRLITQDVEAF